ncbi:hypothetical protein BDV93DRAFT_141945 [Ceratobasidium sp. AG-I]|nr:hypothetical protein BDV93DRAFT_141945 [Ceratobasidium sp. AG-I]
MRTCLSISSAVYPRFTIDGTPGVHGVKGRPLICICIHPTGAARVLDLRCRRQNTAAAPSRHTQMLCSAIYLRHELRVRLLSALPCASSIPGFKSGALLSGVLSCGVAILIELMVPRKTTQVHPILAGQGRFPPSIRPLPQPEAQSPVATGHERDQTGQRPHSNSDSQVIRLRIVGCVRYLY